MEKNIISAGFGGQGVLLIGQLLCYAGMIEGKNVSWLPAYGPEMRGGTANCGVVLCDEEVGSPMVTEPDIAMIMNRPSLDTFEDSIKAGGLLLYNSSLIDTKPKRTDITIIGVPCNEIAGELGNDRVANMVMLGALIGAQGLVKKESLMAALSDVFGPSKAHLLPLNEQAMERGVTVARA